MRLLNARSRTLTTFLGKEIPPYAILSHTWGDDELLFDDIQHQEASQLQAKAGFFKVEGCCTQAVRDGYQWVWIDTCCIDKSSSAELSEAINTMFQWYAASGVCYVYLEDVGFGTSLLQSRWFTRGWTLQELIAPKDLRFYLEDWSYYDDRFALADTIRKITGIPSTLLRHGHEAFPTLSQDHGHDKPYYNGDNCSGCGTRLYKSTCSSLLARFSIAERMSWAALRETTREEDLAYCLFGLFDVNLPLLYGEGHKAFQRLQQEIIRTTNDQSLLAYEDDNINSILASHPKCFQAKGIVLPWNVLEPPLKMAWSQGLLELDIRLCPARRLSTETDCHVGILACSLASEPLARFAILLRSIEPSQNRYMRLDNRVTYTILPSAPGLTRAECSGLRRRTAVPCISEDAYKRFHAIELDIAKSRVTRIVIEETRDGDSNYNSEYEAGPPVQIFRAVKLLDSNLCHFTIEDTYPSRWSDDVVGPFGGRGGIAILSTPSNQRFWIMWYDGRRFQKHAAYVPAWRIGLLRDLSMRTGTLQLVVGNDPSPETDDDHYKSIMREIRILRGPLIRLIEDPFRKTPANHAIILVEDGVEIKITASITEQRFMDRLTWRLQFHAFPVNGTGIEPGGSLLENRTPTRPSLANRHTNSSWLERWKIWRSPKV